MSINIKHYLQSYFELPQVNTQILQYIQKNHLNYESLDDNQLISMLEELRLLDPLLQKINNNNSKNIEINYQQEQNYHQNQNQNLNRQQIQLQELSVSNTNMKNISVTITSGRKFQEFKKKFDKSTKFVISMVGFGQKDKTSSFPIAQNFNINQTLTFKVNQNSLKPSNRYPIQLAITLFDENGQTKVYSVKLIEWRYLLCYGSAKFDVQMAPYYHQGTKQMQAIGILGISMKLSPLSKLNIITEKAVQNQLELQKKLKEQNNNIFYKYASDFWNQYKAIHRVFSNRRVKLYSDTQDKILMPLPKLVTPLYNLKGIESPNHALRFCSLIQFQAQQLNRKSIQKRYSSMLAGKKGNVQDHCNLLCGMLLGFGMKAYVALGYSNQGEHAWVITSGKDSLVFWQCTKGIKFDYFSPKTFNFYKTIHTVYNNIQYYVNIQLDDSMAGTKFNFTDKNLWKSIDKIILEPLAPYNMQLALIPPSINTFKFQDQLQQVFQSKLNAYRKTSKLSTTNFDSILSSILTTALTNYQTQRITGLTFCEQQFQQAIKSYIPINHTFKAFPIQLTTLDAERIFQEMKNQPKCRQIMLSKGESVFFGLRCKVVLFGDNVFALWISLAVRYYKIQ